MAKNVWISNGHSTRYLRSADDRSQTPYEEESIQNNMTFAEKVYEAVKKIPRGKVTTYKEIGRLINSKGYQAIGQALRCNPYAPIVPCHRVVASDLSLGGFMGKKEGRSIKRKIALLRAEGVEINGGKVVKSSLWQESQNK